MAVVEVNKDNFESVVLKNDKKVLVDFNASWCGPCKMLRPVLDQIAETNTNVEFVSINVDDEDELAEKYGVSAIPCLVLIDKGEEVKRSVGLISRDELEDLIGE
jgi:thioredoxin 1